MLSLLSSVRFSCSAVSDSSRPYGMHLAELAQTHVLWVYDAIQPSHPLSFPSLPAFNLSQHQGLFQWVSSSHPVAKILEVQHQSFQWIFRTDFLYDWLVGSPCSPGDSQESSPALYSVKPWMFCVIWYTRWMPRCAWGSLGGQNPKFKMI